jgi:two-component system, NarL family, nitrate/nitrite response regulator NarL
MVKVVVADNSPIHTNLLAEALKRDEGLSVVSFESDSSALSETVVKDSIDVAVISSTLDEQPLRGLEIVRELRKMRPTTRAVLLPDSSKTELVLEAFRAGARGIFSRKDPIELLSKCVRAVHGGQIWANSNHVEVAVAALADLPSFKSAKIDSINRLSRREGEVVRYLAEGMTNREIAEQMKLSQHTVKNYLFRVFDKLGVSSRTELLFMTLSSNGDALSGHNGNTQPEVAPEAGYSKQEYELIKRSAEAGLPAAQLALAQLYLTSRNSPQDLIAAHMWFLIATESLSRSREFVKKEMTPQQIFEAERGASIWLSKRKASTAMQAAPSKKNAANAASDMRLGQSVG